MKGKPASIVAAIRGGKGVEAWLWSGGYGKEAPHWPGMNCIRARRRYRRRNVAATIARAWDLFGTRGDV